MTSLRANPIPVVDAGAQPVDAQDFLRQMRALAPDLRIAASRLARSPAEAEDLLQEALLQAWRERGRFRPEDGPAWFSRRLRRAARRACSAADDVPDSDGRLAAQLAAPEDQELSARCRDTLRAVDRLPPPLRQTVELMAAGASYEEGAQACRCGLGTFKSRLSRAREALAALVNGACPDARTVVW